MQTVQCISHNGSAYLINKSFQLKKKKKQYAIQNFIPDISFPVCYLLYLVLEYCDLPTLAIQTETYIRNKRSSINKLAQRVL